MMTIEGVEITWMKWRKNHAMGNLVSGKRDTDYPAGDLKWNVILSGDGINK